MQRKFLLPITIASLISFSINFFSHQNLLISLINPLTLILSIYLFKNYITDRNYLFTFLLIISFALIPLFYYQPNIYISLLPILFLGFLYLYKQLPSKYILIIFFLFFFFANSFSGEIIKYPFEIQNSQLIFNSPEINYNLRRHQEDALFIPFKMRQILYSELVYVYAALTNFFDFLNLKNLSDILLIVNLYPLFVGIYQNFKQKSEFKQLCLTAFFIIILTASIDRSPDKFQSLYLLGPIFIYLIILGIQAINKKAYFALWILTLFLFISPKI